MGTTEMSELSTTRVRSFRDLQVWQRSMELTLVIYKLTQKFPREEGLLNAVCSF